MKSQFKRALCFLLCAILVLSHVPIARAVETDAEKTYAIYPIVQDIDYDGTEFEYGKNFALIAESGIDQATKNYLNTILREHGYNFVVYDAPVTNRTNIMLGVNGSGEQVDLYEDTLTREIDDLYDQYGGYLLEVKEGQITIVGQDTDAVYHGIASLKMMFDSMDRQNPYGDDATLLGAQIEDYAGIEYRGFIEGFYGGWDYETRADLMRFARNVKMNMYVYASKTDAYHTNRWADLYPEAELQEIAQLVQIGQETKCYYVWSVHLGSFFNGLNISSNPSLYEQRYSQLVAKLTQLYDVGVRKFDILNDDFGSGSHADVVTVLNRLNREFIKPKGCEPITYCPQGYNKAWSGNGAELQALQALDDDIILYWTGDDVNAPITQSTVDYVATRTGQPVSYWLNYPVNEHAKSGIFLGNIDYYARDGVTGLKAAVSNPSRFGRSNKVALFQLASLFWNNKDYSAHSADVWNDAFNYMGVGSESAITAYRKIARHIANCPGSSRVGAGFPESENIREDLETVLAAVANGESLVGMTAATNLRTEFQNVGYAIDNFRRACTDEALIAELDPWLKSLNGIVDAADSIVYGVTMLNNGISTNAWTGLAQASKHIREWDAYQTCPDVTNKALAGSKRIQPFVTKLMAYLENNLTPMFDANYSARDLYAVLGGQAKSMDANAEKMFDGDLATVAQWNVIQQQDDYYGVDLGVVRPVTDITIVQGNTDTDHDIFHKAVLEYSEDGETFTQLGEQYNDTYHIELDGLNIEARYVRLRLVETGTATKPDYWTHVREFTVNREAPEGTRVYTNVEDYAKQPLTIDGKEYSLADLSGVTLEAGQYIGIKLENLSMISALELEGTGLDGLRFEYSVNGAQWTAADTLEGSTAAKYVRLYNDTDAAITFDLAKLGVTVESTKANPKYLESSLNNALQQGAWENAFDGDDSTFFWTNEPQTAGDYIIFDLGANISLYDVTLVMPDGNPRLYNGEIQISTDKTEWETIATVENDNSIFEVPYRYIRTNAEGASARYLRILFNENSGYYFKLHEVYLNTTVEDSAETAEITATFGSGVENLIDGSLSTLFTGHATTEDYIEYRFTEATNYSSISLLQDPTDGGLADISVLKDDGWVKIGTLDDTAKKFELNSAEPIYGMKVTFPYETNVALYEIYLTADKSACDDIGEYVDPIIVENKEDLLQTVNLASGKTVTVSNTTNGYVKENANDGDPNTRWEGDYIKGTGAAENAWIYIDLGADKTSIFDEMTMCYFKKVYPTLMYIQISNDANTWYDISKLTSNHNGPEHPDVTKTFDDAYTARYVRLLFEEMNSVAAGHAVGLEEWSINGFALSNVSVKSIAQVEDQTLDINAELVLPAFLNVVLTQPTAGDLEVLAPVDWDLTSFDATIGGVHEIEGTVSLPGSVSGSKTVTAQVTVVGEAPHEHSYEAVVTAPTCTEGGYTTYTCDCGESYVADETSALGHDWDGTSCKRCDATRVNPFEDVPEGSYYINPVLWAVENGITSGVDATHFGSNAACTRAQVVTFLWSAAGKPEPTITENPFVDVKESNYYYKAVLWALENGVTAGLDAEHFGPDAQCTRAQVVTFLWNAKGKPEAAAANPFTDVAAGAWYESPVLWAVENGITSGLGDGIFGVSSICTRAQVVTFLYKAFAE